MLCVIMFLWRPSQNNKRYAFTPLLDAEGMTLYFYFTSKYELKFGILILDDDMTDEDDPFYDDKVSKRLINGSSSKEKARVSFVL